MRKSTRHHAPTRFLLNTERSRSITMRKSTRHHAPTLRARQHLQTEHERYPRLPRESHEIKVKWVVHRSVVWWNATVVSVDQSDKAGTSCVGELLYHKLDNYNRERASVVFSVNKSTGERCVAPVDAQGNPINDASQLSSWVYSDEPTPDSSNSSDSEHSSDTNDALHHQQQTTPSRRRSWKLSFAQDEPANVKRQNVSSRAQSPSHSNTDGYLPSSTGSPSTSTPQSVLPKTTFHSRRRKEMRTSVSFKPSSTAADNHNASLREPRQPLNSKSPDEHAQLYEGSDGRQDGQVVNLSNAVTSLTMRIHLMERQLQDFMTSSNAPPMPSSSLTVIVGLKWALMKRMERPLKVTNTGTPDSNGLSTGTVSVRCDCDSKVFRDISHFLAWRHGFSNDSRDSTVAKTSRTQFIPDLPRATSSSLGSDNVFITFSVLSDLTDLLSINDEDDFEQVLCKEVKSSAFHLIQISGCLETVNENGTSNDSQSVLSSQSNVSIQTSSSSPPPFQRVFIGAAPHDILADKVLPSGMETTLKDKLPYFGSQRHTFSSVLFEQPLQHFSVDMNCFRAKWRARLVTTSFLSGRQAQNDEPDKVRSFFLKWNRAKAPSLTKWTRDAQTLTDSVPGQLLLSIPVVNCSARPNSSSISNLMDNHVETYMSQRTDIQRLNKERNMPL